MQRFPGKSSYTIIALTIIPLLLMILLIQYMLKNSLFGLVELLFQLFVFLYCLGPQNLWADTFSCINALTQGDSQTAADKLKSAFGVTDAQTTQSLHGQLLSNIFVAANRRIFAIVFWFLALGPVGAVLYRTITLSSADYPKQNPVPELIPSSRAIEALLDWVPVRIFTCIFALGGHCVKVLSCWRKKAVFGFDSNEKLLSECGSAALGSDDIENIAEDGSAAKSAISLLDRSLVITLVFVAIIVLLV
jgi:membrane protein required for beta-lactamase induction